MAVRAGLRAGRAGKRMGAARGGRRGIGAPASAATSWPPCAAGCTRPSFRERVVTAYGGTCALCSLRHRELLDAAHIIPDSQPRGTRWCPTACPSARSTTPPTPRPPRHLAGLLHPRPAGHPGGERRAHAAPRAAGAASREARPAQAPGRSARPGTAGVALRAVPEGGVGRLLPPGARKSRPTAGLAGHRPPEPPESAAFTASRSNRSGSNSPTHSFHVSYSSEPGSARASSIAPYPETPPQSSGGQARFPFRQPRSAAPQGERSLPRRSCAPNRRRNRRCSGWRFRFRAPGPRASRHSRPALPLRVPCRPPRDRRTRPPRSGRHAGGCRSSPWRSGPPDAGRQGRSRPGRGRAARWGA